MKKTFCDYCGKETTGDFAIITRDRFEQEIYDVCKQCYDNLHSWMREDKKYEFRNTQIVD